WDAGSVDAFVAQMNSEAASLGMTKTKYADAAGLMPESVSTAHDQILLAHAAMADEAFASIVREQQAALPGAGVVYNTNSTLGSGGIVGIKTGWTEYAGACFLFAAEQQLDDRTVTVIGAVLGQNTLSDAYDRSRELILIAGANVSQSKLGSAGDVVGQVKSRWGETSNVVLVSDANILVLPGMQVESTLVLNTEDIRSGEQIGVARFSGGNQVIEVPIKAESTINSPSISWRLERIR
ncbi:MAG TPA: D-alanyl-D-alanine carboxypeptidase, partial [Dehalococcoidia bacterium]|nr:D-alanyl-D-alanine carboxypeptidase [Dehalococcoidia bacterium]